MLVSNAKTVLLIGLAFLLVAEALAEGKNFIFEWRDPFIHGCWYISLYCLIVAIKRSA